MYHPNPIRHLRLITLAVLLAALGASVPARADGIAIQNGEKIAFLGDSITAAGWGSPSGYVRLVIAGLGTNGVQAVPVPAGISGHTSKDMLARIDRDVLSKKPDWMTLSCGVNDVWHGVNGVALDQYKINITSIVDQAQAAHIKVVILTSTMIGEEPDNDNNKKLADYNDFLRSLAKDKACPLADLNADMQADLKAALDPNAPVHLKPGRVLTADGVHMNPHGDEMMASGILKALGLNDDQLKKARDQWEQIPDGWRLHFEVRTPGKKVLAVQKAVSIGQYGVIEALAAKDNKTVSELLQGPFDDDVKALLKPTGDYETLDAIFDAHQERDVQSKLQTKFEQRITDLLATK